MDVSITTFYEELNNYKPKLLSGDIKMIHYFRPIHHGIENGFSSENLYIGTVSQLPLILQILLAVTCFYKTYLFPNTIKKQITTLIFSFQKIQ